MNLVEILSRRLPSTLGIFQNNLFHLMSLARENDLSLQLFFTHSFSSIGEIKMKVENPCKAKEFFRTDKEPFIKELESDVGKHQLVVNLHRSRYRFPPQLSYSSR